MEEDTEKELEQCRKERDEYLTGWQRERADFINYKREVAVQIQQAIRYANEGFLYSLLPILDTLERAEKELNEDLKKDSFVKGFLQIAKQLREFVQSQGVEELEAAGKPFDPNTQQAVEEVNDYKADPGTVVEVVEKGYELDGKVIRPAKVKIAKEKE